HIFLAGVFSMLASADAHCEDGHGWINDSCGATPNHPACAVGARVVAEQSIFYRNALAGERHNWNQGNIYSINVTDFGNGKCITDCGYTGSQGTYPMGEVDYYPFAGSQGTTLSLNLINDLIQSDEIAMPSPWSCDSIGQHCPTKPAISVSWGAPTMTNTNYWDPNSYWCINYHGAFTSGGGNNPPNSHCPAPLTRRL